MGPYPFGSGQPSEPRSAPDLDWQLADAGYRIRSSNLRHVAHGLELLESATMAPSNPDHLCGLHHYNPSDLATWVDSMLSEISPSSAPLPPPNDVLQPSSPPPDTWTDQICPPQQQFPVVQLVDDEEDSGIRLVHLLMTCADSIQRGESRLAASLIDEMRLLLTLVNTGFGIGKVAGYFVDALIRRLYNSLQSSTVGSQTDYEILYHYYYESCPYLKFAHFTANQAILEAFDGHDRVHVIDFNLMHGLQWPALIQALALRPGGPPFLRLTGIGPPSPDGRDSLREVGLRLAELARSAHVRFAFRGVAANRLDDVRPWMLQVAAGEALAINSVMQLHKLLGDADMEGSPVEPVLDWMAGLKPKIVTVVEQEADHNKPAFLDRFTEALFYYSTVFDSMEGGRGRGQQQSTALAEVYLQREICNIVCCEGANRVERHEPLAKWRARLGRAGLRPVHLGSNAFKQASMLLTLFSGEGYCVDEVEGCLTLGWHSRPLISASAWRGGDDDVEQPDSNITINSIARDNNSNNHNNNSNNNYNNASSSSSTSSNNNNNNNNNSSKFDRDCRKQQHNIVCM